MREDNKCPAAGSPLALAAGKNRALALAALSTLRASGLHRNLVNAIRATKMPRSDCRCVVRSAAGPVPSPSPHAPLMADADSMFVEFKQACGRNSA
ncbi:hypothetical protein K0M31_013391 [Melipona bicolor]|uniref:Uncharacterized protein n=1 Tax=Melipona bicolor TaxID=60889 RepID=A0AA40FIG5_9HYME|nr:hypothetical protein K0M31_013391 [Melipona bicolor]